MKKFLILFAATLIMSCAQKEIEPIPDDIFSIEKMTDVMVDIQLIESGIVIRKYSKTRHADRIKDLYKALYIKHTIDKQEFDLSMKFYTHHPDRLEEVYAGMLERLSELEAKVTNEKSEPPQTGK